VILLAVLVLPVLYIFHNPVLVVDLYMYIYIIIFQAISIQFYIF